MLRTEGVYSGSSNRLFKSFKTGLIKHLNGVLAKYIKKGICGVGGTSKLSRETKLHGDCDFVCHAVLNYIPII